MAPRKKKKSLRDELAKQTMMGADGVDRELKEFFKEDDFDEARDKSNIFVRHDALLRVAKQVFGGIKSRIPHTIQYPTKENDWCAVVEVVYTFMKPDIEWGGVGDCRSRTANVGFKNYTTALAETRASSRALRGVLGVEICTQEEITNIDDIIDKTQHEPAIDSQKELIKHRMVKKHGKNKKKIMKSLSEILARKIVTLDQLTRGDAENILENINTGD